MIRTLRCRLVCQGPNSRIVCNTCNYFFYLRTSERVRTKRTNFIELPQQSPPSQSHAQLLFSSSQFLSFFQSGEPHLPAFGHFLTSALQSLHLHSVLVTLHNTERERTYSWLQSALRLVLFSDIKIESPENYLITLLSKCTNTALCRF